MSQYRQFRLSVDVHRFCIPVLFRACLPVPGAARGTKTIFPSLAVNAASRVRIFLQTQLKLRAGREA